MQDCDFLNSALEQAFRHPIIHSEHGLSMIDYTHLTDCFRFCDDYHNSLLPFALPLANVKKYSSLSGRAVKQRHNPRLYAEYEIYKHDLAENIIVPPDYAEVSAYRKKLDLSEMSRQAAQKKKIVATVFPAIYQEQYQKLQEQYPIHIQKCEEILLQNQKAYNISLINDFVLSYKRTLSQFNISNFVLWLNKKRFRYYLNEAAQLLKSHQAVSVDFYEDHPFIGDKYNITRHKVMECKNNLKQLLFLLKKMAHDHQLLNMAQAVIAHKKNFAQMINEYRGTDKLENLSSISALRHCMQDLFNKYALLTYLNGVRFAFENKYLNECPETRHPALPTVSPQNEIKKIAKIVDESYKINAESGKIKQLYLHSLKEYEESQQKLIAVMSKTSK